MKRTPSFAAAALLLASMACAGTPVVKPEGGPVPAAAGPWQALWRYDTQG